MISKSILVVVTLDFNTPFMIYIIYVIGVITFLLKTQTR